MSLIQNPATEKACELVNGIRRRVDRSPTDFHKLLEYLREKGGRYHDILRLLEETYSATELPSEASLASFPVPFFSAQEKNGTGNEAKASRDSHASAPSPQPIGES